MSADNTTAPAAQPLRYPSYMADLIDRAASVLKMRWPCTAGADFDWWADGEDHGYHACLEWTIDTALPRVRVFDRRSGDFVCQSIEGKLFDIDPAVCVFDVAPDEVARHMWGAGERLTERKRRQRKAAS